MNYWENKKVLITGASGFIGSNAAIYFAGKKSQVKAVIHNNEKNNILNERLNNKYIETIEGDLLLPEFVKEVTESQEIILNFAALDGSLDYKKSHSAELLSKNLRINLNMLESAVENEVSVFLLVSSADIYSPDVLGKINEKSRVNTGWNYNVDGYKLAKWISELAAKEFSEQYNLDIAIIRPSNIYGPGDDFSTGGKTRFIPAVISKVDNDQPVVLWGSGKQKRSFLYVEDFLKITAKLIESKAFGKPINIASEMTYNIKEVAKIVYRINNKNENIIIDNTKPGGAPQRIFDLSLLKKYIGDFSETDFQQGVEETISFYKRYYASNIK